MINFMSPDFIIGVIVILILGVIFLVGHAHGKSSVLAPTPAPLIPPTVDKIVEPDKAVISAVSEVKEAVTEVKSVATESHGMLAKIHEHLFADKQPTEPPKAA